MKDFDGFSQSLTAENVDTNKVEKLDSKSDLKTILDVQDIFGLLRKDISLHLPRKTKLELEDINFEALNCKTPNTNTDLHSEDDFQFISV